MAPVCAKLQSNIVRVDASVLTMAKRFGGYTSMTESEVRPFAVSGDALSHLREKREMLRDMTVEQILPLIEYHSNLNVFEALDLAKKQGKLIVPNIIHDRILHQLRMVPEFGRKSHLLQGVSKFYPVWTGTAIIYQASGVSFMHLVSHSSFHQSFCAPHRIRFEVPQQFKGKMDCALSLEHPDFEFVSAGTNRLELKAAEGSVSLLEHFPSENEWYHRDERFGIPVGDRLLKPSTDTSSRYLMRNRSSICLVACGYPGLGDNHRRGIQLATDSAYSDALGVALF